MSLIDPGLLQILCCPETHQPIAEADAALLSEVNERIARQEQHFAGVEHLLWHGGRFWLSGDTFGPISEGGLCRVFEGALVMASRRE